MRKVREWEERHERRLEGCQIWGAIAASVIGAVVSSEMGSGDREAATDAQKSSADAQNRMAAIAEGQFEISKEQYELYKTEVLPMVRQAVANISPYGSEEQAISKAVGDVRGEYAQAGPRARRAMELSGRNPSDPVYTQMDRNLAGMESADVARAMTNARTLDREQTWNRRLQAIAAYNDPAGASAASAGMAGRLQAGVASSANSNALTALKATQMNREAAGQGGYAGYTLFNKWRTGGGKYPWESAPDASGGQGFDANSADWNPNYYGGGGGGDFSGYNVDYNPFMGGARDGGVIRRRYANGGEIQGPGTGTSDSIRAIKEPGTFILSADTVRALGTKKLTKLMEEAGVRPGMGAEDDGRGAAIRLSNGEWAMPPEVTKYHGEEAFNKLQERYHRPVFTAGDAAGGDAAANGGVIRKRAMPREVEDAILRHLPARSIGARA